MYTYAEKLYIWRVFIKGYSITEMAKHFKVGRKVINVWFLMERREDAPMGKVKAPNVGIRAWEKNKKPHQVCQFLRWRHGVTQAEVFETLNVSRQWFSKMENGTEDCAPLVAYWKKRDKKEWNRITSSI